MDWEEFITKNWALLINWFTNDIHNSSKCFWTNWDHNWMTDVLYSLSSNQTFSRVHSNSSDIVST